VKQEKEGREGAEGQRREVGERKGMRKSGSLFKHLTTYGHYAIHLPA